MLQYGRVPFVPICRRDKKKPLREQRLLPGILCANSSLLLDHRNGEALGSVCYSQVVNTFLALLQTIQLQIRRFRIQRILFNTHIYDLPGR